MPTRRPTPAFSTWHTMPFRQPITATASPGSPNEHTEYGRYSAPGAAPPPPTQLLPGSCVCQLSAGRGGRIAKHRSSTAERNGWTL